MKFKGTKLFTILFLFILASCSMQVEDKNSGMSSSEKKDLVSKSNDDSFEVKDVKFETKVAIREDLAANSNITDKYYTLKVCLKDKKLNKGLSNRPIYIDDELKYMDASGCVRWDEQIPIDPSDNNRCRLFEKTLKISKNKSKVFKYSIDYVNDLVTDLDKSKGCMAQGDNQKTMGKIDPIVLSDVQLAYDTDQTKRRSDLRYKTYITKVNSCIKVSKTGAALRYADLRIKFTNKETGEISYGLNPLLSTNEAGCFTTDYRSQFEQYKYSHWMDIEIEVEVLSGSLKGLKTTRIVYVNPWEPRKFGIGERGRIPIERKFKSKYAKMHLDGVMYIQIGNDTKQMQIDDYLGLTIAKTYQVVLNPWVNREHRYTPNTYHMGRLESEGDYKLSMVVLAPKKGDLLINKHNYEDFEFITGVKKIVKVQNGIINEVVSIPFPVNELPRLAVRTMTLFKLEPVNSTGLKGTIVSGFFKARIPWIKTQVLQEKALNLENYVTDVYKAFSKKGDKGEGSVSTEEMKNGHSLNKQEFSINNIQEHCSKDLSNKEIAHEECMKGMTEILTTDFDEKTVGYNKYVEDLFSKLTLQEDMQRVKGTTDKIKPKEIYVNHLKKNIKNIEVMTATEAYEKYEVDVRPSDFNKLLPKNKTMRGMTYNMIDQLCTFGVESSVGYKDKKDWEKRTTLKDCKARPMNYFDTQPIRHVEKLEEIGKSYTNGFNIHFGERYGVSENDGTYTTDNSSEFWGVDMGMKVDVPFVKDVPVIGKLLPNFGLKAGKTWAHNEGRTKSEGYQLSEAVGSDKSLAVEKFVVNLHAQFERCILIASKEFIDKPVQRRNDIKMKNPLSWLRPSFDTKEEWENFRNPKANFGNHFYICDDRPKLEKYTEAWYFVQARIDSSLGRDYDGVLERKILRSFRSEKNYFELRQAMRDINEKNLVMHNISHGTPEEELVAHWGHLLGDKISKDEAAKYLVDHVEGSFPGTIEGHGAKDYYEIYPEE